MTDCTHNYPILWSVWLDLTNGVDKKFDGESESAYMFIYSSEQPTNAISISFIVVHRIFLRWWIFVIGKTVCVQVIIGHYHCAFQYYNVSPMYKLLLLDVHGLCWILAECMSNLGPMHFTFYMELQLEGVLLVLSWESCSWLLILTEIFNNIL